MRFRQLFAPHHFLLYSIPYISRQQFFAFLDNCSSALVIIYMCSALISHAMKLCLCVRDVWPTRIELVELAKNVYLAGCRGYSEPKISMCAAGSDNIQPFMVRVGHPQGNNGIFCWMTEIWHHIVSNRKSHCKMDGHIDDCSLMIVKHFKSFHHSLMYTLKHS